MIDKDYPGVTVENAAERRKTADVTALSMRGGKPGSGRHYSITEHALLDSHHKTIYLMIRKRFSLRIASHFCLNPMSGCERRPSSSSWLVKSANVP